MESSLRTALIFDAAVAVFFTGLALAIAACSHEPVTHVAPPPPPPVKKPAPPPCYFDLGQHLPDLHLARRLMLRKLHLVRPDLIPYPMLIEVYA